MIRYQEMVPDYYIEKSRDFQILCRMYDFAMNGLKYNIDSMQSLTDTRKIKDTVLPLLGDKLGIYDKEAYANRQMLEALPIAIKYKGSLKSVKILLNAFLDSMDIFETAIVMYAKTVEEAEEISGILNRKVNPYSLVIIMSAFPNLTNLHVLDVYLKMVIPSGMLIDYGFGVTTQYLDKFKYKDYAFILYTKTRTYEYEDYTITVPMVGMLKEKSESYAPVFEYAGTDNIKLRKEFVGDQPQLDCEHVLTHQAVPKDGETVPVLSLVIINTNTGEITKTDLPYEPTGKYIVDIPEDSLAYIEYYFNRTAEFITEFNKNFDVNAVSIGAVMSKEEFKKEMNE